MSDWFKFYCDGISEPRMQLMLFELPATLATWVAILCECGRSRCGTIRYRHQDAPAWAHLLHIAPDEFKRAVDLLAAHEYVILNEDGTLRVRRWEAKQSDYARKKKNQKEREYIRGEERRGSGQCPDNVRTMSGQTPDTHPKTPKNGTISPTANLILRQKELERCETRMKAIRDQYDSHQDMDQPDRAELKRLKTRVGELKDILGLAT